MSLRILQPPADIFANPAYALVVPVNCVGTAGAGLARVAAGRWPAWAREYRRACYAGEMKPGGLLSTFIERDEPMVHGRVLAIATKDDWRNASRLEWVVAGLERLAVWCARALPSSVAVPALGCGLGQLDWQDVRPVIERVLGEVRGVEFHVFAPHEVRRPRAARRG